MMEILLLGWVLFVATLWLARILVEELYTAIRSAKTGVRLESPRIARRRARDDQARESGRPTVGQAMSARLAERIANPREHRVLGKLRDLLAELAEDALDEARVRHHVNQQARATSRRARQDGWSVQTGSGPPPAPEDPPDIDDDVVDAVPCQVCGRVQVVPPDEVCDPCEAAEAGPPPDPRAGWVQVCRGCAHTLVTLPDELCGACNAAANETPPPPPGDGDTQPKEEHPMASATHIINGDVRDPRTSLAFVTGCRQLNDAVVIELDILAANMRRQGVGAGAIGEIRVLADAARNYSRSNQRSVKEYAGHVVSQAEIAGDADLRNTVRRTYLDTRGNDAGPAPTRGSRTVRNRIAGGDCASPAAGARLMDSIAGTYAALQVSVDQAKGMHSRQGVSDAPVQFLAEQLGLATAMAQQSKRSAATFRKHVQRRDDTVGKNKALRGTQKGRYLDPAKA